LPTTNGPSGPPLRARWRVRRHRLAAVAIGAAAIGLAALTPPAVTTVSASTGAVFKWTASGSGAWTDAANWTLVSGSSPNGYPRSAGDTAEFGGSGGQAVTVTVSGQVSVGALDFVSSQPYTIIAGDTGAALELSAPGDIEVQGPATDVIAVPLILHAPLSVSLAQSALLSVTAPIGEAAPEGITELGSGSLELAAPNTYSGGLTVEGGTLALADDGALGLSPGQLLLEAGTAVAGEGGARTLANPVELDGNNGHAITFSGTYLTFTSSQSTVLTQTSVDVENRTAFDRLLDGQGGHRSLRVGGSGSLSLSASGSSNIGYATGSIRVGGPASFDLGGTGSIAGVSWEAGSSGTLSIGPAGGTGQLTTGGVSLNAATTYRVALDGTVPGSGYDQLLTRAAGPGSGNVSLGDATLEAQVGPGTAVGDSFTVIQAAGRVTGRFAHLAASGCTIDAGGQLLSVTYNPSSVVLTEVANPGDGPGLSVDGFPSPVAAGSAGSFTVTATDCDGNPLPSYRGRVTFSSSDPAAQLPAPYTFTAADAGSHTFSATLLTPGTQSLTATDASLGLSATQSGIVVDPASSPTPTPTPDPTPTPTPTATPTPTPTGTPSPTPTPRPTPTPGHTPTPSPAVSPSPTPTPRVSPTPTPSSSPSPKPGQSPSPSPTPTSTLSPTSSSPSATPTPGSAVIPGPSGPPRAGGSPPGPAGTAPTAPANLQPASQNPSPLARAAQVAGEAAFPLILLVLMLLFIAVQNEIDRRDPKLKASPLLADPDLEFQ
jgi:autotransporter-associated beta strand protein